MRNRGVWKCLLWCSSIPRWKTDIADGFLPIDLVDLFERLGVEKSYLYQIHKGRMRRRKASRKELER